MKTRTDKTIPVIIIVYGLILILLLLILTNFKLTTFSLSGIIFGSLVIIVGIWKIETFEIVDSKLIKKNFLGLIRRSISFENLLCYNKKTINTDHFKNPFNIIKFYSRDKKYFIFRQITVETKEKYKLKIDERTMNTEDFNLLLNKLKGIKSR